MKHEALDEMLEKMLVGGRLTNEKSVAKESWKYGRSPEDSFEFPAERERKKKLKQMKKSQYFKIKGR